MPPIPSYYSLIIYRHIFRNSQIPDLKLSDIICRKPNAFCLCVDPIIFIQLQSFHQFYLFKKFLINLIYNKF